MGIPKLLNDQTKLLGKIPFLKNTDIKLAEFIAVHLPGFFHHIIQFIHHPGKI